MRYFTYLAEQAFETSATGERLFYPNGPWSRPFLIPDAEIEKNLFRKQRWLLRLLFGWSILGQPILLVQRPEVIVQSKWFLIYLCCVLAVLWVVSRILFARELKGLGRASGRMGVLSFCRQMAQQDSWTGLFLRFLGSMFFAACGLAMLTGGFNIAGGILISSFFGLCAVAMGFALCQKALTGDMPTESDEIRRA